MGGAPSQELLVIRRNYHIQGGEIDLIMEKNGIITFVEVKLRTAGNFGGGAEAVTASKKKKLLRTIFTFMQNNGRPRQWQLDLIDINYDKTSRKAFIQHLPHILEA